MEHRIDQYNTNVIARFEVFCLGARTFLYWFLEPELDMLPYKLITKEAAADLLDKRDSWVTAKCTGPQVRSRIRWNSIACASLGMDREKR